MKERNVGMLRRNVRLLLVYSALPLKAYSDNYRQITIQGLMETPEGKKEPHLSYMSDITWRDYVFQ